MRRLLWILLCASAFGQGGIIGPKGIIGPSGIIGAAAAAGGNTIAFVEAVGTVSAVETQVATITSTNTHDALFVGVWGATAFSASCPSTLTDNKSGGSSTYTAQWHTAFHGSGDYCYTLFYLLNTAAGITQLTSDQGVSGTHGGLLVLHFSSTGSWTAVDQSSAIVNTPQATPFASSSVTTLQAHEVLLAPVGITLTTFNTGIQNAYAATGSWIAEALCAGSTTSPCVAGSGNNLDGGNGSVLGLGYQIVTTTQSGIQNTGTNNGSTNVYANYPGIVSFY